MDGSELVNNVNRLQWSYSVFYVFQYYIQTANRISILLYISYTISLCVYLSIHNISNYSMELNSKRVLVKKFFENVQYSRLIKLLYVLWTETKVQFHDSKKVFRVGWFSLWRLSSQLLTGHKPCSNLYISPNRHGSLLASGVFSKTLARRCNPWKVCVPYLMVWMAGS